MSYYVIEPDVAGGLGPHTIIDTSKIPPVVSHLHYEFEGRPDDALFETYPCYIVRIDLANVLRSMHATGIRFGEVEVSKSLELAIEEPELELPRFLRMDIFGRPEHDDVYLTSDYQLVVSERVLNVLKHHGIEHATVSELT